MTIAIGLLVNYRRVEQRLRTYRMRTMRLCDRELLLDQARGE